MDDDGGAGRLLGGLDRYSRHRDRPQISHRAASLLTALYDALQPYVTVAHVTSCVVTMNGHSGAR